MKSHNHKIFNNLFLKRIVTFVFVILFCFESFSAVVSDNDGSAFITKAEFDSLKNEFQSQLDSYNSSIDNKLDNAIASYLAGVNISKETNYDTMVAPYRQVTLSNYVLTRTPRIQNMIWNECFGMRLRETNNYYIANGWNLTNVKQTRSASNDRRLIVDAGDTSNVQPTYVKWLGVSRNFDYTVNITRSYYDSRDVVNQTTTWTGGGTIGFVIQNMCRWNTGLWTNNNFMDNFASPAVNNVQASSGTPYYWTFAARTFRTKSYSASADCVNVNGYKYDSDFWCTSGYLTGIKVTDPDWIYSVTQDETNTLANYNFNVTAAFMYCEGKNGTQYTVKSMGTSGWAHPGAYNKSDSTSSAFQICDLVNTYATDRILSPIQIPEVKSNITIDDGVPLFKAKKGNKYKWTAKLTNALKDKTSPYNGEFFVVFSYGPFKDHGPDPSDTPKIKVNGTEDYYVVTNNKQVKVEFEMPEDGYIFVKWEPAYPTPVSNWSADLDMSVSNTYTEVSN